MSQYQYNPLAEFGSNSLQFGQQSPMGNFTLGGGPLGDVNPYTDPNFISQAAGSTTGGAIPSAAGFQFGMNAPTLQMGMSGLNSLANIWGAWQANKLAKDQLNFTKSVTNTNLNNSIKSYNTSLEDRARARGFTEGRSDSEIQNYVSTNRLSR